MSAPAPEAVAAIIAKLRAGKWRLLFHARLQGGGMWAYQSLADPRVQASKTTRWKRGEGFSSMTTYSFGAGDEMLHDPSPGPLFQPTLTSIDDVARVVAAHDAEQDHAAQPSE